MAKKPIKGTGTSKVRFIMLEAEMPEGDLTQITTAIQNALRPVQASGPRVSKPQAQMVELEGHETDETSETASEQEIELEVESSRSTSSRVWKPAKRKVIDLDLDSDMSFAAYVEQYPPKSEQDKYLVAVAYFCEHCQDIEEITADHVYTCFRKIGWGAGAKDFSKPLRSLKSNQFLDAGPAKGSYVVDHIGLDKVYKLADG